MKSLGVFAIAVAFCTQGSGVPGGDPSSCGATADDSLGLQSEVSIEKSRGATAGAGRARHLSPLCGFLSLSTDTSD